MVECGAVVQPDVAAAGGISECKKIADMANAFGLRVNPHVWGTGVTLAASLQLLAILPDNPPGLAPIVPLLEFDQSEHPFRMAVLQQPIEQRNGWVAIPDGPGLGIDVDRPFDEEPAKAPAGEFRLAARDRHAQRRLHLPVAGEIFRRDRLLEPRSSIRRPRRIAAVAS